MHFLSLGFKVEERHTISTLRRNGSKPSHIAQQLGRHVSTINRELRRKGTLEGGYQYRYAHAPGLRQCCVSNLASIQSR